MKWQTRGHWFHPKSLNSQTQSSLDHETHEISTKSGQLQAKHKEIPQKGVEQPHLHKAVRSQKPLNRTLSIKQKPQISPKCSHNRLESTS